MFTICAFIESNPSSYCNRVLKPTYKIIMSFTIPNPAIIVEMLTNKRASLRVKCKLKLSFLMLVVRYVLLRSSCLEILQNNNNMYVFT